MVKLTAHYNRSTQGSKVVLFSTSYALLAQKRNALIYGESYDPFSLDVQSKIETAINYSIKPCALGESIDKSRTI